ncbi:MAG TPA: hypothetical protein VFN79_01045, partial [Steroidobacteraceae bacterium]|nr:hypothetical protein [Steroidobacteraceae bacterium]
MFANDFLNYAPRYEYRWERALQERMAYLADAGVTPREIVQRVVEVMALDRFEQRFENTRERDYGLARSVFQLRSMGTWRPAATLLRFAGAELF